MQMPKSSTYSTAGQCHKLPWTPQTGMPSAGHTTKGQRSRSPAGSDPVLRLFMVCRASRLLWGLDCCRGQVILYPASFGTLSTHFDSYKAGNVPYTIRKRDSIILWASAGNCLYYLRFLQLYAYCGCAYTEDPSHLAVRDACIRPTRFAPTCREQANIVSGFANDLEATSWSISSPPGNGRLSSGQVNAR